MHCPNCGNPIEADDLFCGECGHKIEKNQKLFILQNQKYPMRNLKTRKTIQQETTMKYQIFQSNKIKHKVIKIQKVININQLLMLKSSKFHQHHIILLMNIKDPSNITHLHTNTIYTTPINTLDNIQANLVNKQKK